MAEVADEIRAKKFTLVDDSGRDRALLGTNSDGDPYLYLMWADAVQQVGLLDDGSGFLEMRDLNVKGDKRLRGLTLYTWMISLSGERYSINLCTGTDKTPSPTVDTWDDDKIDCLWSAL